MKVIDSTSRRRGAGVLFALGLAAVACARVPAGELQPEHPSSASSAAQPTPTAPAPVASAAPTLPAEPAPPQASPSTANPLCCCTFDSADPADFGAVSTWDSL